MSVECAYMRNFDFYSNVYLFTYLKSTTELPRATYTVGGTKRYTNIHNKKVLKKKKKRKKRKKKEKTKEKYKKERASAH